MRTPSTSSLALLLLLAGCGGSTPPVETAGVETAGGAAAATDRASPELPERASVVVVGSGLTGLTVAYRLAAAGRGFHFGNPANPPSQVKAALNVPISTLKINNPP